MVELKLLPRKETELTITEHVLKEMLGRPGKTSFKGQTTDSQFFDITTETFKDKKNLEGLTSSITLKVISESEFRIGAGVSLEPEFVFHGNQEKREKMFKKLCEICEQQGEAAVSATLKRISKTLEDKKNLQKQVS